MINAKQLEEILNIKINDRIKKNEELLRTEKDLPPDFRVDMHNKYIKHDMYDGAFSLNLIEIMEKEFPNKDLDEKMNKIDLLKCKVYNAHFNVSDFKFLIKTKENDEVQEEFYSIIIQEFPELESMKSFVKEGIARALSDANCRYRMALDVDPKLKWKINYMSFTSDVIKRIPVYFLKEKELKSFEEKYTKTTFLPFLREQIYRFQFNEDFPKAKLIEPPYNIEYKPNEEFRELYEEFCKKKAS